jgi:hypothetical protein
VTQPPQPDQRERELIAALVAYQAASAALRLQLAGLVTRLWRQLGSYRTADVRRFVVDVVPLVAGAQQQMSALTAAGLARQREISLGDNGKPVAVDVRKVTGAAARNGADPREVYERPFHLVWRQLAELPREPGSIDKAIQSGLDRALDLAGTDVQLAKVHTAYAIGQADPKVRWQQRVLEGAHSCGLCIVASTQTYHNSSRLHPTLMPIHPGCDCSVRYAYGDSYPAQILDVTKLADVHDRIEQRFGRSSSSARVIPGSRDSYGRIVRYRDVSRKKGHRHARSQDHDTTAPVTTPGC